MVHRILEERLRVVVLDTLGEYGEEDGLVVCETVRACVRNIQRLHRAKFYGVSCRILNIQDALKLIELCYVVGDMTLVIEETSMYCSPTRLPSEIAFALRYGRHRRLDQIYVARRPAEINREVTSQSDAIICFTQREPRDIEYLSAIAGKGAEVVKTLADYHFVVVGKKEVVPKEILVDKYCEGVLE